jgi:hypothetical protein
MHSRDYDPAYFSDFLLAGDFAKFLILSFWPRKIKSFHESLPRYHPTTCPPSDKQESELQRKKPVRQGHGVVGKYPGADISLNYMYIYIPTHLGTKGRKTCVHIHILCILYF